MIKFLHANLRIVSASLCGIALVGGFGVFKAKADSWDKKTTLTIHEPIQVRERLLEPGTYVFKLLNSNSDRHIVQIYNQDQSRVIDTVLAIPNYRLQATGSSKFGFWETPPGHAKALRSWFYPGQEYGEEFPYPKHLAAVETAGVTITRTQMPLAPQPEPQQVARLEQPRPVEPSPVPAPAPAVPQQPQEFARNAPPPAPEPAPAPAPTPFAAPEPQAPAPAAPATLPRTATSFPAIGLGGLCCLVVFGLVRDKGIKRQP